MLIAMKCAFIAINMNFASERYLKKKKKEKEKNKKRFRFDCTASGGGIQPPDIGDGATAFYG